MVRYVKFFSQYLQRKKYNYIKRMSISLLWARRFCRKLIRKSGNLALSNVNDEMCTSSCWWKSNSAISPPVTIYCRTTFFIFKVFKPLKLRSTSDENTNIAILGHSAKQIFTIQEQRIFFFFFETHKTTWSSTSSIKPCTNRNAPLVTPGFLPVLPMLHGAIPTKFHSTIQKKKALTQMSQTQHEIIWGQNLE